MVERAKRIIPCLDMKGGRVVKGVRFVELRDAGNPVEIALQYCGAGADELVLLDIDATHEGRATLLDVVAETARHVTIPFTVGGGISTASQADKILAVGASKVSMNSAAVKNPGLVDETARLFGSSKIVVAVDVKKVGSDHWEVYTGGGRLPSGMDAVAWAREVESRGAGEILLTSMDADGVGNGYDLAITRRIADAVKIPVIASGGAGSLKDFSDAAIDGRADAMLAATLFHFGHLTIRQVKEYLRGFGILVNL